MGYSFVKSIGTGTLPANELRSLRNSAIADSHTDAILKEALLDKDDYDRTGLKTTVAAKCRRGDVILSSFPDDDLTGAQLLVRSEFMILREVGDGRLSRQHRDAYIE